MPETEQTAAPQVAAPSVPSAGDKAAGQKAADAVKAAPGVPEPADSPQGAPSLPDGELDKRLALQAENDRLRRELEAAGKPQTGRFTVPTIWLRVLPPHVEMHHGGLVIERDWTEVPEHMSAALMGAAYDSGVKIEQKED